MTDSVPASDALGIARELILRPGGLDDARLDQVFGEVLRHRVDFADLYFQISREESWALEDGIVKDGSASIEQGVGAVSYTHLDVYKRQGLDRAHRPQPARRSVRCGKAYGDGAR